ncbi:hypothetical protein [Coleofasciculus sp. FACHB-1120]|uniref:hypothetical protein n=1 Tax=Coleofasciculus sp. FACHB-1120 TaxID=2692783 RepID=UPI0016831C78|nr:hypothetical protein [Coleofasciculus sp. FACHB-1120]MBD2742968.1 hypothetical protein [Coleofasciculus sp. FACHB-1120]
MSLKKTKYHFQWLMILQVELDKYQGRKNGSGIESVVINPLSPPTVQGFEH